MEDHRNQIRRHLHPPDDHQVQTGRRKNPTKLFFHISYIPSPPAQPPLFCFLPPPVFNLRHSPFRIAQSVRSFVRPENLRRGGGKKGGKAGRYSRGCLPHSGGVLATTMVLSLYSTFPPTKMRVRLRNFVEKVKNRNETNQNKLRT